MPTTLNLTKLKNYLPRANSYLLAELLYSNALTEEELKKEITKIKSDLSLGEEENLIVNTLLFRQSKMSVGKKAKVIKAKKILNDITNQVALDKAYCDLLSQVYAQVNSKTLIQDLPGEKTVNALLENISEPRVILKVKAEENLKLLNKLYSTKKINLDTFRRLYEVYGFEGATEFKQDLKPLLQKITEFAPDFRYKEELASKVLLADISEEELKPILDLYNNFPYPLTVDDLETVYFKYGALPKGEIQNIFKTILMRLPYKEEPYENLALAVKILKEGRAEIFDKSLQEAQNKQNRLIYMQELAKIPFFADYQDELTLKFFGKKTLIELGLDFKNLLKSLPFNKSYKENTDIGLKIILGKLPFKVGYSQALYRQENKAKLGEDPLRIEALQKYSGPQSKEEVLEFLRLKLKPYTFYKKNDGQYCAALAYLIDELNGKTPAKAATVALELFEQGLDEKQVEEILNKFLQKVSFDEEALLTAYKRFFEIKHDKEDAVERVLNMLD